MVNKINIDESPEALDQWASFMKGEKLYELDLPFEMPDGKVFYKTVVYEPATARMLADIYEDLDRKPSNDDMYDRTAQLFELCVKNIKFNNKKPGNSDFANGEMSVQDLTLYQKTLLEAAISPGANKSAEQIQQDVESNRRSLGKKLRRKTTSMVGSSD